MLINTRESKLLVSGFMVNNESFSIIRSYVPGRYIAVSAYVTIEFTAHHTPTGGYYSHVSKITKDIVRGEKVYHRTQTAQRFLLKYVPVVRELGWAAKILDGLETFDHFLK